MVFCILPNSYTYKEQQQQTFHPQEIKRLRSGQGKPALSFLPLDCPGFSHANQTVSGPHLPPRGSHPLPSAPRPPPSCSPWSQPSLPLSPEPGSASHKDPGWAVARLSHPDAGGCAGSPAWGWARGQLNIWRQLPTVASEWTPLPATHLSARVTEEMGKRFSQLE